VTADCDCRNNCGRKAAQHRTVCNTCRSQAFREANPTYHRDYWRATTPEYKETQRDLYLARQRANAAAVAAAKSVPCTDCGGIFPLFCMDLDHVPERGPKLFRLNQCGSRKPEAVLAEIAKCDAVCANCHRTRTRNRAKGPGMV
jgi:hypothetical protein